MPHSNLCFSFFPSFFSLLLFGELSRMGTVRDTLAHADDAVKRGESYWQVSKVPMLMPELAQESHPGRHSHAAVRAMKPKQYAVTFSLLPTMASSSQKKALWPVSFLPIVAYTRYNAADPILVNRCVGTGCRQDQSSGGRSLGIARLPQVVSCCSGQRTQPRPREPGRRRD